MMIDDDSSTLHLVDESGCFLMVTVPDEIENATEGSPPASDGEDDHWQQVASLGAGIDQLKGQLARQTARYERLWQRNCQQMIDSERQLEEKDDQIRTHPARLDGNDNEASRLSQEALEDATLGCR